MRSRNALILVGLALTLQYGLRFFVSQSHSHSRPATSSVTTVRTSPTRVGEPLQLEGSPEDFVASVLDVKPAAVTGLKLMLPDRRGFGGNTWQWECQVEGRRVVVSTVGGGAWDLRLPAPPPVAGASPSPSVTLLQARAVAVALVQRRLKGAFYGLEPNVAEALPKGDFYFAWAPPDTATGSSSYAAVYIDPAGRIKSYNERPAHRLNPAAAQQAVPAQPEPPQDPAAFLASVLGTTADKIPAPKSTGQDMWTYVLNGREWTVMHYSWSWEVDSLFGPRYQPTGAALSADNARIVATGYLRRRWQGTFNRSGFLSYSDAGTLMYSYSWSEHVAPWVSSGNSASVIVYGDGMLHRYSEHRVPPGLSKDKVKVGQAQARAAADKLVAMGAKAEGRTYTYQSQGLTLWDDQANAPIWTLRYVPSGTEADWKKVPVRFAFIRVDGTTGAARYQ